MRRFRALTFRFAPAAVLFAVAVSPASARADVTIYDNNGWSVYTKGLIGANYQLIKADDDPSAIYGGILVGGKILPIGAQDSRDRTITLSRVRSGFIGTQLGWGINRQISERVRVESLIALNINDISSNRGHEAVKSSDFREVWAAVVGPAGTFKFGRMFSIFGSASAPILLMAYRYGVGNPCVASETTISCGSTGAGPLYAGFDAQMRYITPRVAGFELQIAVSDPVAGPDFKMTPYPRFDAELNFDRTFGPARVRLIGQGLYEQLQRTELAFLRKAHVWGGMGVGVLDVGGFSIGGGGWTGKGIGTRVIMEAPDAPNPVAYDSSTFELRLFRGFFGNVAFDYHGTAIAVGGGTTYVRPTNADTAFTVDAVDPNVIIPTNGRSVIAQQTEGHIVLSKRFDTLVLTAEYMHWRARWYWGEKQNLNFMGVGANYFW